MKKTTKRKFATGSLLVVVMQIFLLLNSGPAYSYLISESDISFQKNSYEKESDKFNDALKSFGTFFSWFFSIKHISGVSAQEDLFNCCLETNNGATCQNIAQGFDENNPESCSNPLPTRCEQTVQCAVGTCVIDEGLSCSANSPKNSCEDNGGIWHSKDIGSIPECGTGACVMGDEVQLTTEKQCELISQSNGLEMDFRAGVTELEFPIILGDIKKGACIVEGLECRFATFSECSSMNGDFYEDTLCTNPNLETSCEPTEETMCLNDKVYFKDSCGNPGNVYDSSKVNADENPSYWNKVSENYCVLDINNPNSVESCGACSVFSGSQCSTAGDAEIQPDYGQYACKNLGCFDSKGNERKNGEKWCLYDGAIGDGKDTVGSEHYLASCNNGEIEVDVCGTARGQICNQKVIEENGESFSTASCVVNEAIRCINYNSQGNFESECNDNPQCQITNVDVDESFKFGICTPKFPKGFDQKESQEISGNICSAASQECTVIYEKQIFGGWTCIQNCECETKKFSEEMNNLCISLGDCGSYVNFNGQGTDNIKVSNAPSVSWSEYTQYSEIKEGEYVELELKDDFISSITGGNIEDFTPEKYNSVLANLGASGISFSIGVANQIYNGGQGLNLATDALRQVLSGDFSLTQTGGIFNAGGPTPLATSLTAFGVSAIGGILGSIAGEFLVDALGISGQAATIVVMASGVAGSVSAVYFAQSQGFISQQIITSGFFYGTIIAVAVIIAIIIIFGFGQTKEVKVEFTCMPWQAPTGGNNCEACNDLENGKPCTKYKCESLGQACELINENTDNPTCQSIEFETSPPRISTGKILSDGFEFTNEQQNNVKIQGIENECIQEFNFVDFTLETDEFAQCKWDLTRKADYKSMESFPLQGTAFSQNHTFTVGGLSLSFLEASNISGDVIEGFTGNIEMYIKCQDYFGNFNLNDYVVNFCINSGDDLTPVSHANTMTNPLNGAKIPYGESEVNFTMWTNEPAECKYSKTPDLNYESMENSFSCSTGLTEREIRGWPCTSALQVPDDENNFYIKCRDQPWLLENEQEKRNTNLQDFVYTLETTSENIEIDRIYIRNDNDETELNQETFTEIKGGDSLFEIELAVETSKGIDQGVSQCSYKWNNQFIPFLISNSNIHKQKLNLVGGNYEVPIKCEDDAGNSVEKNVKFSLNLDSSAPKVVRTYYQSGNLNLITNEDAKCWFSFDSNKQCHFNTEEAEDMESLFSTVHSTKWISGKKYYIKCEDVWENQNPSCAVEVTAH